MNKSIQVPVLLLLFSVFCAAGVAWAEEQSPMDGYQIQPGDILAVSVWREPDLEREILVRPDGGFAFPLAGDIQAQGMTVEQLRGELVKKLSRFVPDPVVTVSLQQMTGNRIYVLGRVQRPGEFNVVRPITVLQALAMAGGLTPYADEETIQVLRGAGADQQSMPFNYAAVAEGQGLEQNVLLQAGDVVMVP